MMRFIEWLDDKLYFVLEAVSLNHLTPGFILDLLSRYPSSSIQQSICYNKSCPVRTLIRLSNSESWAVLYGVYFNKKTPLHILEKLSLNEANIVRMNLGYDLVAGRPLGKLRVAALDLNFLLDCNDSCYTIW